MPDLDPLPRRPRPPSFAPRPGDYAGVVTRARRRRRTHLRATGVGAAGVAAAFALVASHGGGTYGLRPAPPAAHPVRGLDQPAGSVATPSAASSPAPLLRIPAGTRGGSTTGYLPPPGGGSVPSTAPSAGTGGGTVRKPRVRPVVVRDEVAKPVDTLCDSDPSGVTASGWCLMYEGDGTVKTGGTAAFAILACRYQGMGAQTLTFDTEQQVEFTVVDAGFHAMWHWSQGWAFPKTRNTLTVPDGRCARWTVHWDTTNDSGRRVAPAQYYVSPNIPASSWGNGTGFAFDYSYGIDVTEN